ncbi:hypothetical protein ACFX1Z_014937 [Malus domestica]
MSANEYYRMFTNLSRYDSEVAASPVEMIRRFSLGTKKKWRSIATSTHCASYQEFYEILLRIKASKNMTSESKDEEGKNGARDETIKEMGKHFRDPARPRTLRGVVAVPALLAED